MHKNSRVRTSPVLQDLKDISIKVRSMIVLQPLPQTKSTIIEIKPQEKILYHCYRRYKSFVFAFDEIYENKQFYHQKIEFDNASEALKQGYNYCLICYGTKKSGIDQFCEGTQSKEGVFYLYLSSIFHMCSQTQNLKMKLSFFCVNQDQVLDLISLEEVQIREGKEDNQFYKAQSIEISTLYQLYNSIKNFYALKKTKLSKSFFVIVGQIVSLDSRAASKKILCCQLVNEGDKEEKDQKIWNSNSLMILNQCLTALSNRINSKGKQFHGPFRNSRITRILKPFLCFNTKLDVIGTVHGLETDPTYHTLGMIKNFGKIRIPCTNVNEIQLNMKNEKLSNEKPSYKTLQNKRSTNTIAQVQQASKEQINLRKQLEKIRNNKKIFQENSLVPFDIIISENPQQKSLSKELEQEELNQYQNKQKNIIKKIQTIKKQRLQTIMNTQTKTEKLQMMKKLYTIELDNQEQQMKQKQQEINKLKKIYHQRLKTINQELKKRPSELLHEKQHVGGRRSDSLQNSIINEKKLPEINYHNQKKKAYLREKIKKGRVDLKQFFQENIKKYQQY